MLSAVDSAVPSFSLSRFVAASRFVTLTPGRTETFEWLPNGRTALVARVLNGEHAADVAMLGPRTRALFKHPTGIARVLLLSFKPGWSASLFGVSARALTDRIVPLEELWGRAGSDLASKILAASSLPEMLEQISSAVALRSRRTTESASARLARRAASLLEGDAVKIESVAAELGVTGRHLRRAFSESIGVSPKDFARGARLQRAVHLSASSQDWGRIATEAGYYDQAHLISDFRDLTGLTPSAFLKRAG